MGMTSRKSDRVLSFPPASIVKRLLVIIIGVVLIIASSSSVFAQTTNSDSDQAQISHLLKEIELRKFSPAERDTNGNVVSFYLHSQLADDERIEAASKIHSLRKLYLQGSPAKNITKEGISHLAGMTNIELVSVGCGGELNPGVFEEICKIHALKQLRLLAARPPAAEEYSAITNLQLLTVLYLGVGTNFGDHELSLLTNLHNLKDIEIPYSGITSEGMKVLSQMDGLTNVKVRPGR